MSSVFYRSPAAVYPVAVRGEGMYIVDAAGKRYLDMSGGAAVSCVGHSHPEVVAAVREQVGKLAFAHTAFFTNEPQEELALRLATRFGERGARVYFSSGGSEANETALKLAWQYWAARGQPDRKIIVSREHSYHGNTFGVLSVSGNAARRRASAAPLLDWPRIAPCYAYRECAVHETLASYVERVSGELEQAIVTSGADRVAAFICEPVVGSSLGVAPAELDYLQRIRRICDRYDVLWIADEIMCGGGRTGSYFAFEQDGVSPDIVTLAKGIGGGYQALAATIIAPRVAETLHRSGFAHGHTYIGHATACAAGCAVQKLLDREDLLARCRQQGERFAALLQGRFGDHPRVGDIRGRGLFRALELVSERATRQPFEPARRMAARIRAEAMNAGLLCYPMGGTIDGKHGDHVLLAPPFIIDDGELDLLVERLSLAIDRAIAGAS